MARILVVDDEESIRLVLEKFLRSAGHEVICAQSAEEAWEFFAEAAFPLVVTDLQLGGMSGVELLERINSSPKGRDSDVIVLTGYASASSAIEALRHGAFDYLQKPVSRETLLGCVTRALERQQLIRENKIARKQIAELRHENRETKSRLTTYRQELSKAHGLTGPVVASEDMRSVVALAMVLHGDRSVPVMIQGETGTGKEMVAKLVHHGDGTSDVGPFVDVNCAAISPSLFESELFGYEGGAFTGANPAGQMGKLELANGGSIFLDEITETQEDCQGKLLRALEEREIRRVGGTEKTPFDARIICATNRDVAALVKDGQFRADLYYRLSVGVVQLTPLREQKESIEPLASRFLQDFARTRAKRFIRIAPDALSVLQHYTWPGNVRELKNTIDRAVLLHDDVALRADHLLFLHSADASPGPEGTTAIHPGKVVLPEHALDFEALEREIIRSAMRMHDNNQSKTARYLGITRSKLLTRLKHIQA